MPYDSMRFGEAIGNARRSRHLTQTQLAEMAGLCRSHLSDIENGQKSPSMSTVWRLAEALGMKPSALIALAED